ncbi:MAG: hypothetical protein RMJ98_10630 [Myxococcales bacterium]|nr:hypothetical protein [Polyangiaceae bacterium]MDW8249741.1 hypothetical protein [Myxococcales bacterium]
MRHLLAPTLLALMALGGPQAAAKSPIQLPRRPQVHNLPIVHVQNILEEVHLASLPLVQLPNFPPPGVPPQTLPKAPAELRLEEIFSPSPHLVTKQAGPQLPDSSIVRLQLTTAGVLSAGFKETEGHQISHSLHCNKKLKTDTTRLIHWKALLPVPDGARLIHGQSWIDLRHCKLGEASRSETQLRTVLSVEGKPLIYAARTEHELLLVTPLLHMDPTHLSIHQIGAAPTFHRGLISLVRMRIIRGGASVFSAFLHRQVALTWWRLLGLGNEQDNLSNAPAYQLRIDLSQAASEPAPLILLTLQRPVAVQQPAEVILHAPNLTLLPQQPVERE